MGDILVKEGHLFSIVFISKFLGYYYLEEYLIKENNFKNRQLIAKFRTSDHCLQIETGRYINNLFKFFFKWNFYLMETLIHIRTIFSIQIKFLKDI
jgi:hypothetical protein